MTIKEQLESAMVQLGYPTEQNEYHQYVGASEHFAKGWHAARSQNSDGVISIVTIRRVLKDARDE